MADGNLLNDELTQLVQQVCRQFMNSFQPRPKRGRRARRGGGGTVTNEIEMRRYRVIASVPAATGHLAENWGTALAALSLLDSTTGEEIDPTHDPDNMVPALNPLDTSFAVDCMVRVLDGQIFDGTCQPFVDWDDTAGGP